MNRKQIRHIFITSMILVAAFAAVTYTTGCKKKCGSVTCQNTGACVNDTCSCTTGYEGTACETLWTTKYLGSYTCSQTCVPSVGTATWKSTITAYTSNGSYTLSISNFGNQQISVVATVDGIGNVTIIDGNGVAGSGTFANNVMQLHYTTNTNNVGGYNCTLTMNKD